MIYAYMYVDLSTSIAVLTYKDGKWLKDNGREWEEIPSPPPEVIKYLESLNDPQVGTQTD